MTREEIETKLTLLKGKYKSASRADKKIIVHQAKLLKKGLEKLGTVYESAKKIFN